MEEETTYRKEEITCYKEMNEKIVGFLEMMNTSMPAIYAAARITELEAQVNKLSVVSIREVEIFTEIKSAHAQLDKDAFNTFLDICLEKLADCGAKRYFTTPLSEEAIKELSAEVYRANYADYEYVSGDEAFHKGVEIGVWGLNNEIKTGRVK